MAIIVLQSSDNVEIQVGKSLTSCSAPSVLQTSLIKSMSFPSCSTPGFSRNGAHQNLNVLTPPLTEREVAERSILIKNMLEDVGESATADAIPIPNVGCLDMMVRNSSVTDLALLGQRGCFKKSH